MDDAIQKLLDQGYTYDEAALVVHVVATQQAERCEAIRTGKCKCGQTLRRLARDTGVTLECGSCSVCHAA